MRLNFVVGDDQMEALKSTTNLINHIAKENNMDAEVALSTISSADILKYSEENLNRVNAYILDINFNNDINGLGIAKAIRDKDPHSYIIFITAHIEFSLLIFKYKLKVFDFLIKPVSHSDMEECIKALFNDFNRVYERNRPINREFIRVKSGYHEHELIIDEIVYIESFGQKLCFHMKEGMIETYSTLKDIEKAVNKERILFHRCHKSFLVNLNEVKNIKLKENELVMSNGDKCPISRVQKDFLKKYFQTKGFN